MRKLEVRRKRTPVWWMGRRSPVIVVSHLVEEAGVVVAEFSERSAAEAFIRGYELGWKEGVVDEYLADEAGRQRAEDAAKAV